MWIHQDKLHNPIQGLDKLTTWSSEFDIWNWSLWVHNWKDIEIGQNILKPYNDEIATLTTSGSGKNF